MVMPIVILATGMIVFLLRLNKEGEKALEKGEILKKRNVTNKKWTEEKLARANKKRIEERLAGGRLADEELAERIAKLRRTEKLQLARNVIRQVNLKEFHLAVSFYGKDERDSLLREENESLNDHYKKEINGALGSSAFNSSEMWFDFFEEIKELGISLLTKSLESESFKTMLEEQGATADNAGQSQKIEKNKSWDELKKEL